MLRFSALVTAMFTAAFASDLTLYGPPITQSLFENLATAFRFSHAFNVEFQSIGPEAAQSHIDSGDAVIIDNILSVETSNSFVFPLFGFPVIAVYNFVDTAHKQNTSLRLSQEVLRDIFLGQITRWNDPNLTAINPGLSLPDQPITRVVGSLVTFLAEGLSIMFGEPFNASTFLLNDTVVVDTLVSSKVLATSFSIGLTWMADALEHGADIALMQNKEGYYVYPGDGMPYALSEYQAAVNTAPPGVTVLPHDMPGRLSWPILGIIYLILPTSVPACSNLTVIQEFVTLVMFQRHADRLVHVLGWEPGDSLFLLDYSLGSIANNFDFSDQLHSITCESIQLVELTHSLGTTSDLWPFALKMLVAYSDINAFLDLSSASSNITVLLNDMVLGQAAGVDIDLTLTWQPLIAQYPLLSVPVFMGSVAAILNLPLATNASLILSPVVLAAIFSGEIIHWDDSQIQNLNPGRGLPNNRIIVFASPLGLLDGPSAIFAQHLQNASTKFSWSHVNQSVADELDIVDLVQFTPYSIGYGFGHNLQNTGVDVAALVPSTSDSTAQPIYLSPDSLTACWYGLNHPECWPLAVPLSFAFRPPTAVNKVACDHQKLSVDFIYWVFTREVMLDAYIVPNTGQESMGPAEFCNGRSLLFTIPEPQTIDASARAIVYVICVIGMTMACIQAASLAIARNQSDLKSASVLFSLLAVVGVFIMLIAPFLIVRDDVVNSDCAWGLWLLCVGFSLAYGSLFAKLFRLYKIFTSRSLVVPRLSNRKLFYIVSVFLGLDFLLMLIYNLVNPPNPKNYSLFIPDDNDLVTGHRELTWNMCAYHEDGPIFIIIIVYKFLIALLGAGMAFAIRQVDRRFTATSALGWAFYNMFLTVVVAIILDVGFRSNTDLGPALFIPVFCGLWVLMVTLAALTLDSNVLLACQEFSKPLRRMLSSKEKDRPRDSKEKDSKDRKSITGKKKENSNEQDESTPKNRSYSSTVFVINREMFPSKYDEFEAELLEKILEELNFQRTAVRRALAGTGTQTTFTGTTAIELAELGERARGSTKVETPTKHRSHSKSYQTTQPATGAFGGEETKLSPLAATRDLGADARFFGSSSSSSIHDSRHASQISDLPTTAETNANQQAAQQNNNNQPSSSSSPKEEINSSSSSSSTTINANVDPLLKILVDPPENATTN